MELIYLWTKKYKNLSGGYKLSAKYSIKYEKNTIQLFNNPNYIDDFFNSKNKINISAIIGENGSGKSSLLKLIISILYNNSYSKEYNKKYTYFLLIEIDKQFYIISNNIKFTLKIDDKKIQYKEYQNQFYTIYFNYMLDSLKDSSKETWIDEIYHKSDDYTMPILLEPYKKNNNIDIDNLNYLTRQRMILYKDEISKNDFLKMIFNPSKVKINIDKEKILKIYTSTLNGKYTPAIKNAYKQEFKELNTILEQIEQEERNLSSIKKRKNIDSLKKENLLQETNKKIKRYKNEIHNVISNIPLYCLNNLYIANKIDKYHHYKRKINNSIDGVDGFGLDRNDNRIQIYIKDKSHNTLKLRNAIKYQELILKNNYLPNSSEKNKFIDIEDERLKILPSWYEVSFYDENNRTFTSLSAGEKSIFILLISIIYQLNNLLSRHNNNLTGQYNNLLIILDEADLGLHPKWQRQFLYNVLETLKEESSLNYHIICTSHSPFIISDLPKDNVLFLNKGNISDLVDNRYTFGENIHTLLNDSFFMKKEMMMGKIAEKKITKEFEFFEKIFQQNNKLEKNEKQKQTESQKLKDLEKEYKEKRNYLIKLQKIIGEEYLRIAFKNSLEECDLIFNINSNIKNEDAKAKIIEELERNPELAKKWLKDLND